MKHIKLLIAILFLVPAQVVAAGEGFSFLGIKAKNVVAFGGPFIEFSSVDNTLFSVNGGKGAFAVGKKYYVGLYGLSSMNDLIKQISGLGEVNVSFSHFGAWGGYMYKSLRNISLSFSMKAGIGRISLYQDKYTSYNHTPEVTINELDKQRIGVISPSIDLGVRMFKWLTVSAAAGYRLVVGKETHYINPTQFNSPSFTVSLLMGSFGYRE